MKLLLVIILCGILTYWANYAPPRNYTNLTIYEAPYPDIAIDIEKEYKDGYIRLLWEISIKGDK